MVSLGRLRFLCVCFRGLYFLEGCRFVEVGNFRDVDRFMDIGVFGMIKCFGHFLGFEEFESLGNIVRHGEDVVWERLSYLGRHGVWGCFRIGDIAYFMEADDFVFKGLV